MIDEIKELIKLLRDNSMGLSFQKKSRVKLLFDMIEKTKIGDIQIVADNFFEGDKVKAWHQCYQLKNKLINKLLNIGTGAYSSRFKQIHSEAYKVHSVVQILRRRRCWLTAISLSKEGLKKAVKINETSLILSFSKFLHVYYSSVCFDNKKALHYRDIMLKQNDLLYFETKAEAYYLEVATYLMQKHSIDNYLIKMANEKAEELLSLLSSDKSLRFVQMAYSTSVIAHQLSYNQQKVIDQSKKAIEYFKNTQDNFPSSYLTAFYVGIINAYIQSSRYNKARGMINECFIRSEIGTQNWIAAIQYACINAFYSRNYEEAVLSFQMIDKKSKIYALHREQLLIIEAIIYLLRQTGRVVWKGKRFRLSKFLNDMPILSKDKAGLNIVILIVQVMFLLLNKKYDEVIDSRLDALKIYSHRHLRSASTARSKVFIRMLRTLPKSSFRSRRWEVLTADLLEELQSLHNRELEYIPYEQLYGIILDVLD